MEQLFKVARHRKACLVHCVFHLHHGQGTVTVSVHRHEHATQLIYPFFGHLRCDDCDHSLFHLVHASKRSQTLNLEADHWTVHVFFSKPLNPPVLETTASRRASHWHLLQAGLHETLAISRHSLPVFAIRDEVGIFHLLQDLLNRPTGERMLPGKEQVRNHTNAPGIHFFVVPSRKNLRRHIVWRTSLGTCVFAGLEALGQAEVDELQGGFANLFFRGQKEVLRLQVAMHDVVHVQVVYGSKHVAHTSCRLPFCDGPLRCNSLDELASLAKFKHQLQEAVVLEALLEAHDVWMIQKAHYVNLFFELLRLFHPFLPDGFDGIDSAGALVPSFPH
mmetsp:Transcript_58370/g.109260  ORF Transcript_58370/g.109260 Transcript_58370/m.109260 type:complete len:333 (+) Transcript_58370:465-1463(+)